MWSTGIKVLVSYPFLSPTFEYQNLSIRSYLFNIRRRSNTRQRSNSRRRSNIRNYSSTRTLSDTRRCLSTRARSGTRPKKIEITRPEKMFYTEKKV